MATQRMKAMSHSFWEASESREPEHIRLLRDVLRRFIESEMPRAAAAKWDKDNHFPREVFGKLAELGMMGVTVPEEYGGSGRDIVATMVVIEELSKRSLAMSVPYIMATCYAGMNLVECGSPVQKRAMLPRVASGDLLFAYGWSEPDVGGDVASVRTTADREGDTLVVNGAKRFCSGAEICDYIFTIVKTDRAGERYRNLSILLIPRTTPGVTISRIEGLGMKGAATTDVGFENVRLPMSSVLGEEDGWNHGWAMITGSGLDVEKIEVAAMSLGIAEAAFADAWDYAESRIQFGQPVSAFQAIRHKLANMAVQITAARMITYGAADLINQHIRCGVETSMAKLAAGEAAKQVALEAQTILGAYGYVRGYDVERYVRDALLMPIIGGSSDIQRNNIVNWGKLRRA